MPQPWLVGKKRRSGRDFPVITRLEFAEYLKKARAGLGSGSEHGYAREPENAIRDAALLAWEYVSGKRVSEFTGRIYYEDVYPGLTMDHWRIGKTGEADVLQFYIRILKRGRRKKVCPGCHETNSSESGFCRKCGASLQNAQLEGKLQEVWVWKDLPLDDPFTAYILEWLNYLKAKNYQGRIFAISRQHAWRIMNNLGIMNHVNRHWQMTHQSRDMDVYDLKEFSDRATPPIEYVHREPTRQLELREKARKRWEGESGTGSP